MTTWSPARTGEASGFSTTSRRLRQITADIAKADAFLFRPPPAWRFRWNKNTDTPLPPDEPAAPNPPDGVMISYLLGSERRGPVTLEIVDDTTDFVLRRYSSADPAESPVAATNVPAYWIRPLRALAATPGLHRFVWDVRLAPPPVDQFEYPISAILRNTPPSPQGMWPLPGTYQLRLAVGGRVLRQAIAIKMDPRVRATAADLALQYRLSKSVETAMRQLADARRTTKARLANPDQGARWRAIAQKLDQVYQPLPGLFSTLQAADARPTAAVEAAATEAVANADAAVTEFRSMTN